MEKQEIINPLNPVKKRPVIITVICVLGFIGSLLNFLMIFSEVAKNNGSWYTPYLIFLGIIGLICMVGLWKMKKWASYVYIGVLILNQFILIAMGTWNVVELVFPAVLVGVILSQVNKMD